MLGQASFQSFLGLERWLGGLNSYCSGMRLQVQISGTHVKKADTTLPVYNTHVPTVSREAETGEALEASRPVSRAYAVVNNTETGKVEGQD